MAAIVTETPATADLAAENVRLRAKNAALAQRVRVLEERREEALGYADRASTSSWPSSPQVRLAQAVALSLLGRRHNWKAGDRREGAY